MNLNKQYFGKTMALATALGISLLAASVQANSSDEIGTSDGSPNSSQPYETLRLTTLLGCYNAGDSGAENDGTYNYFVNPGSSVPAPNLPDSLTIALSQGASGVNGSGQNTGFEINLGTGGYEYAMVKWGDTDEFYYVGGLTGDIFLNDDLSKQAGESHYDLWNATSQVQGTPTPDTAATAGLLAMGFTGLSLLRRKLN